jgi:short-subunit dehydrogenase
LLTEVGVEFSKRYGVEHRVVVLDVSPEDFIGQLASATDDLDIGLVVSNAGTGNPGEFLKLDRQLLQEAEARRLDPRGGNGCGKRRSLYGE